MYAKFLNGVKYKESSRLVKGGSFYPFIPNHGLFSRRSPAILVNFSRFSDNPVTGDEIGDRVVGDGSGNGTDGAGAADMVGPHPDS